MSNSIYWELEAALKELEFRRTKTTIRHQVTDIVGEDLPCYLHEEARAVLFRHIATPDMEMQRFYEAAKKINLPLMVLEFSQDLFMSRNRDKSKLGKLCFFKEGKKAGDYNYEYLKIFDFAKAEKVPLKNIMTKNDISLVDFHHKILAEFYSDIATCDVSEWILEHGEKAKEFYKSFFCLFLAHGILFESFLEDGDEASFTTNVVRPALEYVVEQFGVKPLIVKIISDDEWHDKIWWSYSNDKLASFKRLIEC